MEEKPMQEFLKEEKMREPSCNSVLKTHMVVSFWSVKKAEWLFQILFAQVWAKNKRLKGTAQVLLNQG